MSSKIANAEQIVAAIASIVSDPKSDVVSTLTNLVSLHTRDTDKVEMSSESFVFSIGTIHPQQEAWMLPFLQTVASLFGCVCDVQSVTKRVATFRVSGRTNDVRVATRACNATITRVHHDAWKSVRKSDVPCATQRASFCTTRGSLIDTITRVAISDEVRAYATRVADPKTEQQSA